MGMFKHQESPMVFQCGERRGWEVNSALMSCEELRKLVGKEVGSAFTVGKSSDHSHFMESRKHAAAMDTIKFLQRVLLPRHKRPSPMCFGLLVI